MKCLWHEKVPSLKGFKHLLTTVLKITLDPKRPLGGDYADLAGAFGKDLTYIWYLESRDSPVEELLRDCNPTLINLYALLTSEKVNRPDVAAKITSWVEDQGCQCSNCSTSLR